MLLVSLKELSHEMDLAFDDMHGHWSVLGLIGTQTVFKFFRCSNDFLMQKEYFSRSILVCVGLKRYCDEKFKG